MLPQLSRKLSGIWKFSILNIILFLYIRAFWCCQIIFSHLKSVKKLQSSSVVAELIFKTVSLLTHRKWWCFYLLFIGVLRKKIGYQWLRNTPNTSTQKPKSGSWRFSSVSMIFPKRFEVNAMLWYYSLGKKNPSKQTNNEKEKVILQVLVCCTIIWHTEIFDALYQL